MCACVCVFVLSVFVLLRPLPTLPFLARRHTELSPAVPNKLQHVPNLLQHAHTPASELSQNAAQQALVALLELDKLLVCFSVAATACAFTALAFSRERKAFLVPAKYLTKQVDNTFLPAALPALFPLPPALPLALSLCLSLALGLFSSPLSVLGRTSVVVVDTLRVVVHVCRLRWATCIHEHILLLLALQLCVKDLVSPVFHIVRVKSRILLRPFFVSSCQTFGKSALWQLPGGIKKFIP